MIYSVVPFNIDLREPAPLVRLYVDNIVLNTSADLNYTLIDSSGKGGSMKTIPMTDTVYSNWSDDDDYLYQLIATAEGLPPDNQQIIGAIKTITQIDLTTRNFEPSNCIACFLVKYMDIDGNVVNEFSFDLTFNEYENWGSDDIYIINILRTRSGYDIVLN